MQQLKRLLVAAAYQRKGDVQRAAEVFMEVAASEELPKVIKAFLQKEARATKRATASATAWPFRQTAQAAPTRTTATTQWPFRTSASHVKADSEVSEEEMLMLEDDGDVIAGIEEDFVDMGLDDAVLELSAAEDEDEDEDEAEKEDAAAEDDDAKPDDGKDESKDDAPTKEDAQVRAFARTCRNLQALAEHAAKKKAVKKPAKKKAVKK